jgi:hypothetical protein
MDPIIGDEEKHAIDNRDVAAAIVIRALKRLHKGWFVRMSERRQREQEEEKERGDERTRDERTTVSMTAMQGTSS